MKSFLKPFVAFSALLLAASQSSQAATIYSDSFERGTTGTPALFNGSAPDVGTGTWVTRGDASVTDGTSLLLSQSSTASLAFTPVANQIYTITTTLKYSASAASSYFAGLGFFNSTATASANLILPYSAYASSVGDKTPWIFFRGGNSDSNLIGDLNARPLGSTSPLPVDVNLTVTNSVTMTLILNTSGSQWTLDALYNGNVIDLDTASASTSFVYSAGQSSTLASSITRVGLSNLGSGTAPTVSVDSFSLTSEAIPEPSAVLAFTGALAAMALRRRRA